MKITKEAATIVVLFLSTAAIFGGRLITGFYGPRQEVLLGDKKAKGNPGAALRIIEYTDFQCPACSFGAKILHEYMNVYSDQIFLAYRHYPLPSLHPQAVQMAVYAECAAQQDKFWPYHDYLFENAPLLSRSISPVSKMRDKAEELQLDMKAFNACVDSPETETIILKEKEEGKELGVRATPTYFVNGEMIVGSGNIKIELDKILKVPREILSNEKD